MGAQHKLPIITAMALCLGGSQYDYRSPRDATPSVTCLPFDSAFVTHTTFRLISHDSVPLASIADAAVSADRQLLVADKIDANVKVYDEVGHWVRTLGRLGDGPGEFREPLALTTRNDSVFVLDGHHGRLSFFSIDGPFLGSIPIPVHRPTGLGIARDSHFYIAGHGRVEELNAPDFLAALHSFDAAGNHLRSYRPERGRERLYQANFSAALLDVHGRWAVLGNRTSNTIRVVNLESDTTLVVSLTPSGYAPPRWPRRRFTGGGTEQLHKLTAWANAQAWLLGVWYLDPGFVLGRFSNPIERHRSRYALAAVDGGPAPGPICASASKVAGVHDGREIITYQQVRDTTELHVRHIRIAPFDS